MFSGHTEGALENNKEKIVIPEKIQKKVAIISYVKWTKFITSDQVELNF